MKLQIYHYVTILVVCAGIIAWVVTRPTADFPGVPSGPTERDRNSFFNSDVKPTIQAANDLNVEAAERCVSRLKESFDGYRSGIRPFCKEVNTWGTRLGVMTRMPSDWWYAKTDVSKFIDAKFAKHLFTDKKLAADIDGSLAKFREEVVANQNTLVLNVRAAISATDLPNLPELDYTQFAADLSSRLNSFTAQSAQDSVVNGILVEVASGTGGFAAQQLLAQLVIRLTTMAATATATAGGSTATGAAVGGGGGALGGPAGAAAGIAIGLVVGGVIDWWMSSSFEAKMTAQLNGMIDEITKEVITGGLDRPGLRDGLRKSCDVICDAYQDSLRQLIVFGGKP